MPVAPEALLQCLVVMKARLELPPSFGGLVAVGPVAHWSWWLLWPAVGTETQLLCLWDAEMSFNVDQMISFTIQCHTSSFTSRKVVADL